MGRAPSIIYKMTHLPTGKFYIGSLKDSSRFSSYITSSKYVSRMMKTNPEEWIKEVLESYEDLSFYEVVIKEQALIGKYVLELGWNAVWNKFYHSGVAECYSPEVSAKRAESQMRPETRLAKSKAMKITMNTPEMRSYLSGLSKIQMSLPGARKAVTEGQMGEKNHFYGKTHLEESKNKISIAHIGRKKMIDNFGKERRVKAEQIESRLREGWKLGGSG